MDTETSLLKSQLLPLLLALKASMLALAIVFYWVYDSALLTSYGLGPELNIRGVFEGQLLVAWLVAHFIRPAAAVFILVGALIGVVLWAKLRMSTNSVNTWPSLLERQKTQKAFFWVFGWEHLVLSACVIVPLLFIGMAYFEQVATTQVTRQINTFLQTHQCTDAVSEKTVGCYRLSNIAGQGHLLIFNGDKALVFMRHGVRAEQGTNTTALAAEVVIHYKDDQNTIITRDYVPNGPSL